MELQVQYATALLMSTAGVVMGAVYDIYRTSLREWRFLRRFSALFDIAFWMFSLVFVFTLLLGVNDGDVRIVVFVLLAIGFVIYYFTAHPLVVASTQLLVRWIYRAGLFLFHTFILVFIRPIVWLWQTATSFLRFLDHMLMRLEPVIVWPVWQTIKLLGKIFQPIVQKGKDIRTYLSKKTRTMVAAWLEKLRTDESDDLSDEETQVDDEFSDPVEKADVKRNFRLPWFVRRKSKR